MTTQLPYDRAYDWADPKVNIPEWAQYLARDRDGRVIVYQDRPYPRADGTWYANRGWTAEVKDPSGRKLCRRWRQSLRARPGLYWAMPKWMAPYVGLICNTGGGDITEMVNGDADPIINLPLSTLQVCVKSQVLLLERLHEKGLLCPPPPS